jgi:hypothetical protein
VDTAVDKPKSIGDVSRETAGAQFLNRLTHSLWIVPASDVEGPGYDAVGVV